MYEHVLYTADYNDNNNNNNGIVLYERPPLTQNIIYVGVRYRYGEQVQCQCNPSGLGKYTFARLIYSAKASEP